MSNGDRKNGVPTTVTSIPLVDPHASEARSVDRRAGQGRDGAGVDAGAGRGGAGPAPRSPATSRRASPAASSSSWRWWCCSTRHSFSSSSLAELLDTWLWRWAAFLIVFGVMVLSTGALRAARLSEGAPDPGTAADHRIGQGDPRSADPGPRQAAEALDVDRQTDSGPRRWLVRSRLVRWPPPDPSVVRIDGPWRHLEVHANGIRFHVVEATRRVRSAARRRTAAGHPAARVRVVLVVVAPPAARPDRRPRGRRRPARLRRQRQAAARLRRLDAGRRHRRA